MIMDTQILEKSESYFFVENDIIKLDIGDVLNRKMEYKN